MFTQVYSGGIQAVDGCIVSVEADVSDGLPFFNISGQLSTEVRESQNRVRTALKLRFPPSGKEDYGESITCRDSKGRDGL